MTYIKDTFELFESSRLLVISKLKKHKDFKISLEFLKLVLACKLRGIDFSEQDLKELSNLDPRSLEDLTYDILPKYGEVFFNRFITSENYSSVDKIKQEIHYLLNYGLNVSNFSDADITFSIPKLLKTFKVVDIKYVLNILNKIYLNIQNPSSKDYKIVKKFNFLSPNQINNSNLLAYYVRNLDTFNAKKFLNSYKVESLQKLRIITLELITEYKYEPKKFSVEGHIKQFIKTFFMRSLNSLSITQHDLTEINQNRRFYFEMMRCINPLHSRYSKYKHAIIFFDRLKTERIYKHNTLKELTESLNNTEIRKSFELVFRKFYEYNPSYAYKNILNIYTKTFGFTRDAFLRYPPVSIKSGVEAILGLSRLNNRVCRYYKFETVFYDYGSKKVSGIKDVILGLFDVLKLKFKDFTNKKIYLDFKSLETTGLPIFERSSVYGNTYKPRGSKLDLTFSDSARVFLAWKRKDNTEGDLDLDLKAFVYDSEFNLKDRCYYRNPEIKGLKHSGDFVKCRSFSPQKPVITAEFIDVNFDDLSNGRVIFVANSFNGVNLRDYDVYFGLIDTSETTVNTAYAETTDSTETTKNTINLNDALYYFKLESNSDSNVVLFSLENSTKRLTVISEETNNFAEAAKYYEVGMDFYSLFKNVLNVEKGVFTDSNDSILIINGDSDYKNVFDISKHQNAILKLLST